LAALAIIELVPAYGGINYCFNNNLTTDTNLYSQYPQFEPGDRQHMPILLGSDAWPMKVDWVRVWQK
jgi:hypothetical protein